MKLQCICGDEHETLFWPGVPVLPCPKTPDHEWYLVNSDYCRVWPVSEAKAGQWDAFCLQEVESSNLLSGV